MAVLIQEPQDSNPGTEDWQRFLYRTTFQGGGLNRTALREASPPSIAAGSRLEVNGTFYRVVSGDEALNDFDNIGNSSFFFVYASPQENTLAFRASNDIPAYEIEKCGWFDGTDRAIMIGYKDSSGNLFSHVLIDDNDDTLPFEKITPKDEDFMSEKAVDLSGNDFASVTLTKGWYRIEMKAGGGAGGGSSYAKSPGGSGGAGGYLSIALYVKKTVIANIASGGGSHIVSNNNTHYFCGGGSGKLPNSKGGTTTTGNFVYVGNSGGGGGGCILEIPELGILLFVSGGGGGSGCSNSSAFPSYGGGGGGICGGGGSAGVQTILNECVIYEGSDGAVFPSFTHAEGGKNKGGIGGKYLFHQGGDGADGVSNTVGKNGEDGGNSINSNRGGGGAGGAGGVGQAKPGNPGGDGSVVIQRYQGQP